MKQKIRFSLFLYVGIFLGIRSAAIGEVDSRLLGIWTIDEGFQTVEFLFRSDGRYQLDKKSNNPDLDFSSTERGRYETSGGTLALEPYEYFGDPQTNRYEFEVAGDSLSLTSPDISVTEVYQFKTGSREDVLAKEQVSTELVRTWSRRITFSGREDYTFRPGGYYVLKSIPEDSQFPPEFIRGRYDRTGTRLTLKPYSGVEAQYEIDFFGDTLTLIRKGEFSGAETAYEEVPGSGPAVLAKAAEAEAFLTRSNWQVGVWEIRDAVNTVDLTIRPDGHYSATNDTQILRGLVRGRYTLEPRRIHLFPFPGQGLYSRDNGDFGKVNRTREVDYYDGELQLIDLEAISPSVTIARKRAGTEESVTEKVSQAKAQREIAGWHLGIWQVNDPAGWMEFTYRPDNRYIAKSGASGVPNQVERGRYLVVEEKVTLAPYSGLGAARGFELDLYDGDLFLIGDLNRMVVARKVPGSEADVIAKTSNPDAMKGERGSILGLWTANLPGQSAELVFRQDGQFRLNRCGNNVLSQDYGLYSVNMSTRTLISDSRFLEVQTLGMDFYGNTLTIYGGSQAPSSYTVNLGMVDSAIAASLAADAAEAQIDAQWLTRAPISMRDPNAVQISTGDIPADPNPGHTFNAQKVFANYQLYRRLISGFVYFNVQGTIKSVPVVNTREWHFFPTGRVLVRFKNYSAGVYPLTVESVSSSWGAYRVDPKPSQRDILHVYADNSVGIEMDSGEQMELTLEKGRRDLFLNKDFQLLSEWAAEQQSIPCQPSGSPDASLLNTGVTLSSNIAADEIPEPRPGPMPINLSRADSGNFTITGTTDGTGTLVIESTASLTPPVIWQPVLTNSAATGPFSFVIPQGTNASIFFRVRGL